MGEKTREFIYEIVKDSDGVYCYSKRGELVRCKDCRYRKKNGRCDQDGCVCYDEDFCSYGRRKDG